MEVVHWGVDVAAPSLAAPAEPESLPNVV